MIKELFPVLAEVIKRMYDNSLSDKYERSLSGEYMHTNVEREHLRNLLMNVLLSALAEESISDFLDDIEKLCKKCLDDADCRIGYSTTGPWSVRLSDTKLIRTLDAFQPFDFIQPYNYGIHTPGYQFRMPYSDDDSVIVSVSSIRYETIGIVFHLQPSSFTEKDNICNCHSWEDILSWDAFTYHSSDEIEPMPYFVRSYERTN